MWAARNSIGVIMRIYSERKGPPCFCSHVLDLDPKSSCCPIISVRIICFGNYCDALGVAPSSLRAWVVVVVVLVGGGGGGGVRGEKFLVGKND